MKSRSQIVQGSIGFLVSIGLIWWVFSDIQWSELSRELQSVRSGYLFFALIVLWGHFFLRALRWRYLLAGGEKIPLRVLIDSMMIGNFATYILPLRAGEFIRPWVLSRQAKPSFSSGFVSVVIERFFDLATVLISFGLVLQIVSGFDAWVYAGAKALSVVALGILGFILGCIFFPKLSLQAASLCVRWLPGKIARPLLKLIEDFLQGALVLGERKNFWFVLLFTVLVWASSFYLQYVFLLVFPETLHSFLFAVSIGVILALAVAAPSAPGFIGVYQTACVAAFALFSQQRETALAYAIVSHLMQYVVIIGYGGYALTKNHLGLKDLVHVKEEKATDLV